jgi:ABC-2 type transport system permease protein
MANNTNKSTKVIKKHTSEKRQASFRLWVLLLILICANVLASYFHSGIDLTQERRFTLTEPTKKLLRNMQEVAVVDVYLKGKFPAKFQRMQEAVLERLRSFKEIAGNKIVFRFSDPLEGKTDKEQKQIVHDLEQKGIYYMQLSSKDEEDYSMKIFFPYALVQYAGKSMPVLLVENPPNKTAEEKLSYSEALLEYKFASAINSLSKPARAKIGYVVGNGEMLDIHSFDMLYNTIPFYYDLDTINLARVTKISLAYDAIIINQPTIPFQGWEKLIIDQYIMGGGHVLFAINNIKASLDSFVNAPTFIGQSYNLELDDLLFKYGIRINNDLIQDKQCAPLGRTNNGQVETKEWVFFPRINPVANHPIVRNMDFILGGFTNSIDTIKTALIKKTILLQSSNLCRTAGEPVRISLSMMNYAIPDRLFDKPYRTLAVLLEGNFVSAFQNRLAPEFIRYMDSVKMPFKARAEKPTAVIVTSVGNIFRNEYSTKQGVLPVGYYPYSTEFFENRSFLLNCLEYLTDKSGVLEARAKQVKLRLLDEKRIKEEKSTWQLLNVALPMAIVLAFASVYLFIRKRRYEQV